MMWIFVAVLVVTGTVIYFGYLKDKINFGGINIPNLGSGVEYISVEKVNINFEMLDKKEFKDLTSFEDAFPFDGKVGREEPFKPNQ